MTIPWQHLFPPVNRDGCPCPLQTDEDGCLHTTIAEVRQEGTQRAHSYCWR